MRFVQQTAERTIVSYSSLHGLVEQNVDIPVPHGRGGRVGIRGLQGFPGQDSTAFVGAERVENPVPRSGGLQGSRPRQASTASSAHSPGAADQAFYRGFRIFPQLIKKCELGSALGVGTECGLKFIHAGGSAGGLLHRRRRRRVDEVSFWTVDVARLAPARHPRRARLGLALGTWRATWGGWSSRRGGAGECGAFFWSTLFLMQLMVVSTESFGSICLSCAVRTWKRVHYSPFSPCVWQSLLLRLGVACGVQLFDFREILVLLVRNAWFDSGYMFCAVLAFIGRITHIFYVDVDSDCRVFSPFSRRMEKYVQSMLQFESLHALFALEVWAIQVFLGLGPFPTHD